MKNWDRRHIKRLGYDIFLICALSLGATTLASPLAIAHGSEVYMDKPPAPVEEVPVDAVTSQEVPVLDHMGTHSPNSPAHLHDKDEGHETPAAEAVHDHSAHAPSEVLTETGFGRFLLWLGKLHPAAVHFPIALLLGAALAELILIRRNTQFLQDAGRFCLWLGTISAVGSALLGWLYGGFHLIDDESILTLHRWNGTGIAILALLALWLLEGGIRQQVSRRGIYRVALLVTALMVGTNGYLGGLMVYGPEQHQWPEAPAEHSH
ncbi:MAG: hypothetical protein COA62_08445 [Rhodobiaceae bacterium]|nr:MAG: hypothetical protein COA62_08445 [Rhodobiaceae bacterium]